MLDDTLHTFFSFLESEKAFLWMPEAFEFKRTAFLNEILESWDERKTQYFRFSGDFDLKELVHQITDRFFIPVRSVNVNLLNQLQDQIDILRQTHQRVILIVDEAHHLSQKN